MYLKTQIKTTIERTDLSSRQLNVASVRGDFTVTFYAIYGLLSVSRFYGLLKVPFCIM